MTNVGLLREEEKVCIAATPQLYRAALYTSAFVCHAEKEARARQAWLSAFPVCFGVNSITATALLFILRAQSTCRWVSARVRDKLSKACIGLFGVSGMLPDHSGLFVVFYSYLVPGWNTSSDWCYVIKFDTQWACFLATWLMSREKVG